MNTKAVKVGIVGAAAVAAMTIGGGLAYAATSSGSSAPAPQHGTSATLTGSQVGTQSGSQSGSQQSTGVDNEKSAATENAGEATSGNESGQSSEGTSTENDGPGGHADANGANVDHQFNGNE